MSDFRDNIDGDFPGFNGFSNQDYSLSQDSQRIYAGTALPPSIPTSYHSPFQLAIFIPGELLQPSAVMKMSSLRRK